MQEMQLWAQHLGSQGDSIKSQSKIVRDDALKAGKKSSHW